MAIAKNNLTSCLIVTLGLFALLLYFVKGVGLNPHNIYLIHAVLWTTICFSFILSVTSIRYARDKYLKISAEKSAEKYDIIPLLAFSELTLEQKKKIFEQLLNSS